MNNVRACEQDGTKYFHSVEVSHIEKLPCDEAESEWHHELETTNPS